MSPVTLRKVRKILASIYKKQGNIYRDLYKKEGYTEAKLASLDKNSFKNLPKVTLEFLAKMPYKKRLVDENVGFNKLVFSQKANSYMLIHRNIEEIKKAGLPIEGERPMVIMQDVYEAVENCLFFYENKILPLIGEVLNPAVIYATARQYNIDSLYTDAYSEKMFGEGLIAIKLPIKSVIVVDSKSPGKFSWPKNVRRRFVLSLPETGPVAYECPNPLKAKHLLHAYGDIYIEPGENAVISSVRLQSCPMIRYESNVGLIETDIKCKCKRQLYKLH